MSSLLYQFTLLWFIVLNNINITYSADCQSQTTENGCKSVSGCEWFNFACICATDVKIDFIFAVDVSGSIGFEGFKQEKEWLADVVQGGLTRNARVGFTLFSTNVNTSRITLQNYTITELVNYIQGIYYPRGWTNTRGALNAIINEYNSNGMDTRQKVAIMTTDGNPCSSQQCPYDVCDLANSIKNADIRLIVLGVGPDLTPAYLTCLLQDPETDYIPVASYNYDDFDKILPQLQEITCPASYDLKITEVKAQTDTSATFGSKFIEIYNDGSTVSGGDIQLNGLVSGILPDTLQIDQSQYFVLYDYGQVFVNVTCVDCTCNPLFNASQGEIRPPYLYKCANSLYFACGIGSTCQFNDNMDNTNWWQQINDTSDDGNELIDEVKYEQNQITDNIFPSIVNGYTFELKQLAFDNNIGKNWAQSCYVFGTPGDPPVDCRNANCSTTTCRLNGAGDSAEWNPFADKCICPTGYFPSECTCLSIPNPSNCVALRIKNSSATWYTRYVWDRADYEGIIEYELKYWNDGGSNTTVQSYATVKRVLNYDWENRGIALIAGVLRTLMKDEDGIEYRGEWSECLPRTQSPTISPTPSPTTSPTPSPTTTPTQSPIHILPWLFIGGDINCASDRCDCAPSSLITQRECCMLASDNCKQYSERYSSSQISNGVSDNGNGNNPQYITIQSYSPNGIPYSPPFITTAYYQFKYIATKNISNCTHKNENKFNNYLNKKDWPMLITPTNGRIQFDGSATVSSQRITFYIKPTSNKIINCDADAIFRLNILNCSSNYLLNPTEKCEIVFPYEFTLFIEQTQPGTGLSWFERELEPILWWLIAGLILCLLIISVLVYWCWNKTHIKGKALLEKENELEELIEEDEYGMAHNLKQNQIGYNPLALGTKTNNALIYDNENMNKNKEIPKNERANVIIEKFDERQEYGQKYGAIAGGNHDNMPSYQ